MLPYRILQKARWRVRLFPLLGLRLQNGSCRGVTVVRQAAHHPEFIEGRAISSSRRLTPKRGFLSFKFLDRRFDPVAALFDFLQRSRVADADVLRRAEVLARNGKHTGLLEKIFREVAGRGELEFSGLLP